MSASAADACAAPARSRSKSRRICSCGRGQSWVRKGLEAWFTLLIEALWPKQRILEVYLNIAEFGQGVFGVGAAAERIPQARGTADSVRRRAARGRTAQPEAPARERAVAYVRSRQQWIVADDGLGGTALLKEL